MTVAGDVLLRVLHLLGGAVLQLEADVVEQQQRHEAEERGELERVELAGCVAVHAVLDRVDHDGEREERQHADADDRADVRDPLAALERDDRDDDRDPDEDRLEHVVADAARSDRMQVRAPRGGRDEGERAADPERVRDPVEDGADAAPGTTPRHLHPLVRPALLGEGRSELGHDEGVGEQEEDGEDDEPRERGSAESGHLAERVEPDQRADGEEEHVEPAEVPLELRLLLETLGGRIDGFIGTGCHGRTPFVVGQRLHHRGQIPACQCREGTSTATRETGELARRGPGSRPSRTRASRL